MKNSGSKFNENNKNESKNSSDLTFDTSLSSLTFFRLLDSKNMLISLFCIFKGTLNIIINPIKNSSLFNNKSWHFFENRCHIIYRTYQLCYFFVFISYILRHFCFLCLYTHFSLQVLKIFIRNSLRITMKIFNLNVKFFFIWFESKTKIFDFISKNSNNIICDFLLIILN